MTRKTQGCFLYPILCYQGMAFNDISILDLKNIENMYMKSEFSQVEIYIT